MEKDAPCGFYIAMGEGAGVWRRELGNGFKMRPRVSFMSFVNFLTAGARGARARARPASGEGRDVGVPDPVPLGSGLRSAARGLPLRAARSHATRHAVKL